MSTCGRGDDGGDDGGDDEFGGKKTTDFWTAEGWPHLAIVVDLRSRRIGARTIEELWKAVGSICDLYTPDECWNYLRHAERASDQTL